ncbi:MAG: glycosyltransferase family 2 protein [Alphaproteobacteria bacterium]|nr:glycosyltransferase family 2 protein [Alphaproteobacteria bacterium]
MRHIDIICPVFREEQVIAAFHDRLSTAIRGLSDRYAIRILYVLDPSSDRSEEALAGISARDSRVEVLVMTRRFGHQAALIAGMDWCAGDALIMLDSDMQHPPELIPELVAHWEGGADIVQTIRRDGPEIAPMKRLTSRWFYQLLYRIGGVQIPVGAADYRLLAKRVVTTLRERVTEQNPFLRGLVGWVGYKVVHVPFDTEPRAHGESKYRPSTLVNFALNGIFSFSKMPLRLCIGLGFAVAAVSLVAGIIQVVFYVSGTLEVPGWASLYTTVIFLGGMQLFFFGILGEYVSLIFDEVKDRPRYIADRRYVAGRASACDGSARTEAAADEAKRPSA